MMPSELELRLRELFARLPSGSVEGEERALAAALAALPSPAPAHRRPLRTPLVAAAATLGLLTISAGALAAAGALHVSLGKLEQPRRVQVAAPRLRVPSGARGIAVVIDGRLWLTTRTGLRIEGLPVGSATLSPNALYVAAGIGNSLVAMAPNGTRAWSQPVGRVDAIAWAPNGLRIAYVVQRRGGYELRTIEGDGDHDRILDAAVRRVAPSWRSDGLAVAYVGAGGRTVVYDFAQRSHRVVESASAREATRLSFAPHGRALVIASAHRLWVTGAGRVASGGDFGPASVAGIGWLHGEVALALNPPLASSGVRAVVQLFRLAPNGETVPEGRLVIAGRIKALAANGGQLVLAVEGNPAQTRLLASTARDRRTTQPLPSQQVLLQIPSERTIGALAVR